jgi:hypothetical protein
MDCVPTKPINKFIFNAAFYIAIIFASFSFVKINEISDLERKMDQQNMINQSVDKAIEERLGKNPSIK